MSTYRYIPPPPEPTAPPLVTCHVCRQFSPASAERCLHCGARLREPPADASPPLRIAGDE